MNNNLTLAHLVTCYPYPYILHASSSIQSQTGHVNPGPTPMLYLGFRLYITIKKKNRNKKNLIFLKLYVMEVMARYRNGVVGNADVAWKMGRIMLKFRPIAPKPVTGVEVTASGCVQAENISKAAGGGGGCGWRKRKIYGGREGKRGRKSKGVKSPAVVTLPLMPETPERKEEVSVEGHVAVPYFRVPTWQRCGDKDDDENNSKAVVVVVAPTPVRPVGSWVTVEGVTDTWPVGGVVPCLDQDACPGFVSDEFDRVTWTNLAYRNMVMGHSDEEEEEEEVEVRVALVTRGMIPAAGFTCFTCRVRVRYACRRRGKVSMAAPCDVWRLADGKLAWRLDVKAALSLALGTYKQNFQL